jgi:protoporphyrinogen oxidase
MACAYQILKDAPGREVMIIDTAPFVGGAGASFKWKEHTLDYGPHAFHTRGSEPEQLVRDLFADEPDALIEGTKQVHVYLRGKRFNYPLQVREALLKFNPFLSARIIIEFVLTSLFHALVSIPVESFENWGKKRFGPTLYKMSFGDYTEKVWKTSPSKISEKFASEKIQGFSFINLIRRLFKIGGQVTEPYYQTWIYHRKGAGELYQRLGAEIRALGGDIRLSTSVRALNHHKGRIHSLTLAADGKDWEQPCSWVINTIPLPHFVRLFGKDLPFSVRHGASQLRYISLILVYIEFSVDKISDDHWFYLLDPHFRFNRVTEQKNLSADTMEPGKTVLSFELTCRPGDDYWKMTDEQLVQMAVEDCRHVHFIRNRLDTLSDSKVIRVPNVYEIYFKNFDVHADNLLGYLREFDNTVSLGRRGLFLQGDQHQAVEMGLDMAHLFNGGTPNRDQIDAFVRKYVRYVDSY